MRWLGPIALLVALAACSDEQNVVPPDWDLNRMIVQPRYDPWEGSAFFDDGRAMRPPPAGTIPRGTSSTAPPPITAALLQEGRARYETFCAPCHGIAGDAATVVAANMPLVKPPTFHSETLRARSPSHVYQVITAGYGMMPAYAYQLDARERWAVAAYVRALQRSRYARLDELPADLQRLAREELPP